MHFQKSILVSRFLGRLMGRWLGTGAVFLLAALAGAFLPSPVDAETVIKMGGSGTDLGTMRILGRAYGESHPNDKIAVLPSLGSSGGVKALVAGVIHLGLLSRPLKDSERALGVTGLEYARTPFIFVTDKEDAPAGFTIGQLVKIFTGEMVRWPDGSLLRLVLRQPNDSATSLLKRMSPEMRRAVDVSFQRKGLKLAYTDQANIQAIQNIPGALGAATLTQVIVEGAGLKVLSINGVRPSAQTIADGSYPHYKRLFLAVGPQKPAARVRRFIDFVFSESGQEILARTGHWTMPRKREP